MKGYDTLWQPGTDHAGIATQMVVERQLDEKESHAAIWAVMNSSKKFGNGKNIQAAPLHHNFVVWDQHVIGHANVSQWMKVYQKLF